MKDKRRTSKFQYLKKFKKLYNNRFQYIDFDPLNCFSTISVKCRKCSHVFSNTIPNHIRGNSRCQQCSSNKFYSFQRFIKQAHEKHGINRYNYQLIEGIKDSKSALKIKCNRCDRIFNQNINAHLHKTRKYGCPFCKKKEIVFSKGHMQVVDFIKEFYRGQVKLNDRKTIKNIGWMQLDIYLPEINFAIQYSGTYWHSSPQRIKYDIIKQNKCLQKNIYLFKIKDKQQWKDNNKKQKIKEQLKTLIQERIK